MSEYRDPRFEELDGLIAAGQGDSRGLAKMSPPKHLGGRPRAVKAKVPKTPRNYIRMVTNFVLPGEHKIDTIRKLVEQSYGYPEGTLRNTGQSHEARHLHPRQIVIYIARLTTGLSTSVIAGYFGLEHCAAIHSYDIIRGCIEHSTEIADFVYELVVELKSRQYQRKPVSSVARSEPVAESGSGLSQ